MNCLLVTATAQEITPFLDHIHESTKPFYLDFQLDVLVTGIGLPAATYSITRQLALKRPDLVVQAGIAGCFDKNIPLGSVVTVKRETIADMGVIENKQWKDVFDMKLVKSNNFPFKNSYLQNPYTNLLKRSGLKGVNAITISEITTSKSRLSLYPVKYKASIESMEGAALHYVCLMEKIPFLQVRSISNYAGERDKKKWRLKESIQLLNQELIRLVESL